MGGCGSGCGHDHGNEHSHEMVLVIVGKLGAPYGIQGWQHIQSFTSPLDNILKYPHWFLQLKEEWIPVSLKEGRIHGQGIVAKIDGVENPEDAAQLTNCTIAVGRDALAELPQDEFYWADLEGLAVITEKGESLGYITHLYDNADTDVMVVKSDDKERHIPFIIQDTVLKVDMTARQVIVDWDPTL